MSFSSDSTHLATANGNILTLKELEPFGVGGRRLCFVHPHDPNKCVKVLRTDEYRVVRHNPHTIAARWRREYNNNTHEMRILEGLEKRIGPVMSSHLPRSYGMVPTDLGSGLVLDLIRDHDGRISRSIRELITVGHDLSTLRDSFDGFGRFLLDNLVLTRNLLDHNLVVQMQSSGIGPMFLIDGFGDPAWIPVSRWIPALGRAKVHKRLNDAWLRFEKFAANNASNGYSPERDPARLGILRHRG